MATKQFSLAARLLAGLLALTSTLAMAQTYRWVDPATGRTMYTDTPPPGGAKQVSRSGSQAGGDQEMPYALRQAVQNFPVILYTGSECEACGKARELLTKRGIPFTEKNIQEEAEQAELKTLVGDLFIPSLKVGRQNVRGFEAGAYNSMLDLAGYPKAAGGGK